MPPVTMGFELKLPKYGSQDVTFPLANGWLFEQQQKLSGFINFIDGFSSF